MPQEAPSSFMVGHLLNRHLPVHRLLHQGLEQTGVGIHGHVQPDGLSGPQGRLACLAPTTLLEPLSSGIIIGTPHFLPFWENFIG